MTDLINAIRDPLWQFVGAALALAAIFVSIWLFRRSQKRKNLFYRVVADESILTFNKQFQGHVKVLVNGQPVEHARLIVMKFITGDVPIKSEDFERPLSINIGDPCRILSAEVAHASPMNLNPELVWTDHRITISPLLLNQGDTFSIKALVSDCPNTGPVDASMFDYRINGVKEINLKKNSLRGIIISQLMFGVIVAITSFVVLSVVQPDSITDSRIFSLIINPWFLLIAIGLVSLTTYLAVRNLRSASRP